MTATYFSLTTHQEQQFAALDALYRDWNSKINVISRKDIDNLYEHHVLHSLAIAKVLPFQSGSNILDVGTGGGFPGIPLAILFPEAEQVAVPDLREMCFGVFQGRKYVQMERDPEYIAWVGENCEGRCPGGETRGEFSGRTCAAFEGLVNEGLARGEELLVIMAHGGTQMAVMERFALPRRDYYTWCAGNGAGFVLDSGDWKEKRTLNLVNEVRYAKD